MDLEVTAHLRRFADAMCAHFGGPVYLVGSALKQDNTDPRDWDVRLRLSDEYFALRYEPLNALTPQGVAQVYAQWLSDMQTSLYTRLYWRWADEMLKYSNKGRRQTGLNIDFQVYPESYFRKFSGHPSMRLDSRV